MTSTVIRVPDEQQGALIFNQMVAELKFDPGIWDDLFSDWSHSLFQEKPPLRVQRVYDLEDRVIEVTSGGVKTTIPLEITRAGEKPTGYNALTSPTTATPAIMPRKKPGAK